MFNHPPFQSYAEIIATFGNPEADPLTFERQWIVREPHQISEGLWIEIASNQCLVEPLHNVWSRLRKSGDLSLISSYDGCFAIRNVRGAVSTLSLHSWGLAIDLNAATNQLGTNGSMPLPIIEAFKAEGFFWGGDFHHRKDPMHFQWAGDM